MTAIGRTKFEQFMSQFDAKRTAIFLMMVEDVLSSRDTE
jgi:hypothetical protein